MRDKVFTWLRTLSEEELQPLLADLLRAMGFERVTITHGVLEFGRDLVFLEVDKLGRETWRGIQAKVTSFTGNLSSDKGLRGILQQCEAALDTEFITSTGEKVKLKEIWLVTTKPLSENAKQSAFGKIQNASSIYIIDGSYLSDLITQYLPELERSKSKPIEDYLVKLVSYCDSVEQYVSYRFNAKFSLSDVYIPTRLSIQVATIEAAKNFSPLPEHYLTFLEQNIGEIIFLSKGNYMPAVLHFQVSEIITRLRNLLEIIPAAGWSSGKIEVITERISSLVSLIGIEPFTSNGSEILPTEYAYKYSIDVITLMFVEDQLMTLDYKEVEALRDYAEIMKLDREPVGSDMVAFYTQREKRKKARERFFTDLADAYNSSVNPQDRMTQIARDAAKLLYRQSADYTTASKQTRSDILHGQESIMFLKKNTGDFQRHIPTELTRLCTELEKPLQVMQQRGVVDVSVINDLMKLEQLTRFLRGYNFIPEENCIRLNFDAINMCLTMPKLVVLGDLGQGKTTLIKQAVKRMATSVDIQKIEGEPLPVICTLATLSDPPEELAAQHLLDASHGDFNSEQLKAGSIAWFLDGFDEVQSLTLKEKILGWFTHAGNNSDKMVLSSRFHAIPFYLPTGMTAALLPFSNNEIEQFVRGFPWESEAGPDLLLDVLKDAPELLELATTPLLLTIIVILVQRRGYERLPRRKEELYKLVLELLLGEWDTAKGLRRTQEIEDEDQRLRVLKKVAFKLYSERKRSFTREEFINCVVAVQTKPAITVDSAVRFFSRLVRDCLVLPLSKDSFGFFHFSIQEYLAAEDLRDDVYPNRVFSAIQDFFRYGGWWEEVLVFYAGLKRDIAGILEELHNKSFPAFAQKYEKQEQLNPNFMRLIKRMVIAADDTDLGSLDLRGPVALAFAELGLGDESQCERWTQMARLRY